MLSPTYHLRGDYHTRAYEHVKSLPRSRRLRPAGGLPYTLLRNLLRFLALRPAAESQGSTGLRSNVTVALASYPVTGVEAAAAIAVANLRSAYNVRRNVPLTHTRSWM